ncbi:MAG: protein BatD [Balneolaceae bacterium]|nr:protein BatD [Balneolaceae bacterium]MCH8548138.1 BatD family protein [Balneolaceae bacterium]
MRETGSIIIFRPVFLAAFTLLLLLPSALLFAQDFELEATVSENRIFIGEQFTLSVEVRGSTSRNVSLPRLPQIDGARVLSSNPSRSTSISIVNGRTATTTSYSWSLIARETGEYTIPPISIEIDGEEHATRPLRIEITERGNLSRNGGRQMPDIFLEVEVDDDNPVPGQQIVAAVVLYFRQGVEITSFQPRAGWRTDGFWKEELQNIRQPEAESVILDGVRYRKATLMRYALFPSRSGELTLNEFPMNVGIRSRPERNDPFGSFFGSASNQRRVSIESEPVNIRVRPLPAPSEQSVAMNAVGDLRVERRLNRTEAETGETFELITTIEGTGNIPLVRRPNYNFPDGLDFYNPQESSEVERRGLNIRGEKSFTELMVARAPGNFEIPAERIAIFDPSSRNYRYIELPELTFRATPSAGNAVAGRSSAREVLQPVSGLAVWNTTPQAIRRTIWFWFLLAIPVVALGIALYLKQHKDRLLSDNIYARAKMASDRASERLERARKHVESGEPKFAYNEMHKAITGFISDRLGLPEAGFSDHELIAKVQENDPDPSLTKTLKSVMDKCATISYAPAGDSADQQADIDRSEQLITKLKKLL